MRTHSLHADPLALSRSDRWWATRLIRSVINRFLLLPLGALIALLWSNTDPEAYFRFSHANAFWVNEIAMAFFLALIAQELFEALMPAGVLGYWHHWTICIVAAIGGLAGSLAGFWLFIDLKGEMMLAPAWPVAAAVDMAAGYYVMRLLYPRRTAPIAMVLLVAAITDGIAMVAATLANPGFRLHFAGLVVVGLAVGAAALLRHHRVRRFLPYWLCAALSWFGFYWLGIHPALAFIPIVPLMPHEVRKHEVFAAPPEDDKVHRAESTWNAAVQIAVFMFGLVNAGVVLSHVDTGSWAILVAAMLGRPAGVVIAVSLAMTAGLTLPRRMLRRDLVIVALATTTGFTFALFLRTVALPVGAVSQQVTLGALATVAGAIVTIGLARILGVGRYQHTQREHGLLAERPSPARR